jgi:ABC-2 type transport system permease protein
VLWLWARAAPLLGRRDLSAMSGLRIFWVFAKLGFQNEAAYRANFWVQIFESLLNLGSALAAVAIIFARTDTLAGWRAGELVTLLGVYFVVYGAIQIVIAPSLTKFMEDVRTGALDFTLVKPADAQLLVSLSEVRVWKLVDLGLGLVISPRPRPHRGRVGALQALGFLVALAAGAITVYGFWMLLATCAFWFVRLENVLMIFWNMYQAGRWPVDICPRWLRWTLTGLVPVALTVTVPAEALAGRPSAKSRARVRGGARDLALLALVLEERAAPLLERLGLSRARSAEQRRSSARSFKPSAPPAARPCARTGRAEVIDLLVQARDLELGLQVRAEVEVRLHAITRRQPILGHHDDRRLQRGEAGEHQVQRDEPVRIESGA